MHKLHALFLAVTVLAASVFAEKMIIKEREARKLKGWSPVEAGSDNFRDIKHVTLTFALKQHNLKEFEDLFWEVSNPSSLQYKKYLTMQQVTEMIAPSDQEIKEVSDWLKKNGAFNVIVHDSKDFLKATMDVETAESLLNTKFQLFEHKTGKTFVKAVGSYSLPEKIANKVDFVSGFRFPNANGKFKYGPMVSRELQSPSHKTRDPTPYQGPQTVYINPLDQVVSNVFLPFCQSGNPDTGSDPVVTSLCQNDGPEINGFTVYINQSQPSWYTRSYDISEVTCAPCDLSEGHVLTSCNQSNYYNGYADNTIYCQVLVDSLENYVTTQFGMTASYDASTSNLNVYPQTVYLSQFLTPQKIWEIYEVPKGLKVTNDGTTNAVAEFLGQYYSPADLSQFFYLMGLADTSSTVNVIGPNNATLPGGEASLDIQFLMGIAQNAKTTFWSDGNLNHGQEPFLDWITNVLNSDDAPSVHSISYGDDEDTLTTDFMNRTNIEFMKAGMRGISLLFSSGDNGVFGGEEFDESCPYFIPSFPASSPYVTTVGGTILSYDISPICTQPLDGHKVPCYVLGEVTSSTSIGSRISSGGGFSNVFTRPDYQDQFVSQYISSSMGNIPPSYYKASGRAYPDIAALAHNFLVILGGQIVPIDGTSAAAPTAASIITLVNDALLNDAREPLGFLNPLLYSIFDSAPAAFNDIVLGDNACSELAWVCCPFGYNAAVGWDAVTGLGSLNYQQLADALH